MDRWYSFRELPLKELFKNRQLRHNLGNFFITCGRRFSNEGEMPDLTGGKRLDFFGHDIVDPSGFIWPFRTTNILIKDDLPILVDAKVNRFADAHPVKKLAVLTHWQISKIMGQILIRT